MEFSNASYGSLQASNIPNMAYNMSNVDSKTEDIRCTLCQQTQCDVRIVGCGCLLHTTCLPLNLLVSKIPISTNGMPCYDSPCPSCHKAQIIQIQVLPLPIHALEDASRLREKDTYVSNIHNKDIPSLHHACGAPASSIALVNGSNKRGFTSRSCDKSYRTGRWASEESTYVDKLIQSFDAGLLALPHGVKLNDFLCEMLSCRTSRLTKKLKNAKLSTRSYRSLISGGYFLSDRNSADASSASLGASIQRAQTLFLKTVTPEWVRIELQFNINRMWRTHLANFCLQIGFVSLDTKNWFASLDTIDYISLSCGEAALHARRKRMKSALSEDVNIAARNVQSGNQNANRNDVVRQESVDSTGKDGVFMVGLPVKRLSEMNLQKMGAECNYKTGQQVGDNHATRRTSSFMDSLHSDGLLKHSTSLASFAELFTTPEITARASRASSRAGSFSLDNPAMFNDSSEKNAKEEPLSYATNQLSDSNVDTLLDDTVESILESSSSDHEHQGRFLQDISQFLMDMKSPFQHVDLWVPMDTTQADNMGDIHVGNSSGIATTSGGKVNGVVYGEQQASTSRLIHSGYITIPNSAPPHTLQRLNEFGMYSKNFSFSPGYGAPGRVYLSGQPSWEANVSQAKPEQFARVGGAKIYGVNTVLGIPVSTHIGNMVVGLYSTSSLTIDVRFEQKCIDFFRILKPEPRWKLTIDVGLRREVDQSREKDALRLASTYNSSCNSPTNPRKIAPNEACIVPPSPTQNGNSSNDNKLHSWNEQSLALLLGKYMPLDLGSSSSPLNNHIANNSNIAEHLMSLRLLLLRHSSCRTALESNIVENIMERYRGYVRANQKESDLILLLVNDWKSFTSSTSVLSGPNVSTQSYYRSPSSLPITSTSYLGSVTSNEYNTTQPLVASSSNCYLQTGTIHPSGRQFSQPESTNGSDEHANLPPDFPYDLSCLGESTDEFRNEGSKCAHTAISNGNTSSNQHINDKNSSPFARVVSEQGPMGEQVLKEGI